MQYYLAKIGDSVKVGNVMLSNVSIFKRIWNLNIPIDLKSC